MASPSITFVHPDIAAKVREALLRDCSSWEEAFAAALAGASAAEPPPGVPASAWPGLAEHVARLERVRECIARQGLPQAHARFGASPHAVERAVLMDTPGVHEIIDEADFVLGVLACPIDELLAYGQFLGKLVELRAATDPQGTVAAYERFLAAAQATSASHPSWPDRLRSAEDGLASLYVRVGRGDDAEALFRRRFTDEPGDTAVAITAARAFLEQGDVARAVSWLQTGRDRALQVGRADLAARLDEKASALRARMS